MNGSHRPSGGGSVPGMAALAGVDRRAEWAVALSVGTMLFALGLLFTAVPRAFERVEVDSLEQAVDEAPASQRRLSIRAISNFEPGAADEALDMQRSIVERADQELPLSVDQVYGPPRLIADTNRFLVGTVNGVPTASPTALTFRVQPELAERSTLVAGSAASTTSDTVEGRAVFEFEISTQTAAVMELSVGDLVSLDADTSDAATRRYEGGLPDRFFGRVAGLRELDDVSDPYWFGDARLHRPVVSDTGVGANFAMYGAVPAELLPTRPFLVDGRSPFVVEQRRDLIADAIDVETLPQLLDDLEALEASTVSQPTTGRAAVAVSLRRVLAVEVDQQTTARSVLVLAGSGVLGVALVALTQLLQVAVSRRRDRLVVARVRGAAPSQIVIAGAIETSVVAAPTIAAGSLVGRLLLGGSTSSIEVGLVAALMVGSVLAAVALMIAELRGPSDGQLGKWGRISGTLVVAVAAGGYVTFRRRGIADGANIDGLVVLVPILVPLAAVFLTRWVLPVQLRQVARAGMRLGPGRLVGLRRAISQPDHGIGLVAVIALALGVAGLGLGISTSLSEGIEDASWVEARAPFRIDTRDPGVVSDFREADGIELAEIGDNQFRLQRDGDSFNTRLINVETTALDALVGGTAADLGLPDEILATADGDVPAVAASRIGGQRVRRGDLLRGTGSATDVQFVVVETREEAFGRDRDWVIVDRLAFESALGTPAPTSALLFDVSPTARSAVTELVETSDLELVVRSNLEDQQRSDPLVGAVRLGYLGSSAVVLLLAVLAVVGLGIVTARQRRREVAVLGLLGAPPGEISRSVRWELLAPVAGGVALGSGLGWFLAESFDGRFDLSAFAAGQRVTIEAAVSAQVIAAALTSAVAASVVAVLSMRIVRTRSNGILRVEGAA